MKKSVLHNNVFNESFMALCKDKSIKPWAKNRIIRMHQVILKEAEILGKIHKETMENYAEKDGNGMTIYDNVQGNMIPKVGPQGMTEVEKAMSPLMEEEIEGIRPINLKDLDAENYSALAISSLVSAGVIYLPDEEEDEAEQ